MRERKDGQAAGQSDFGRFASDSRSLADFLKLLAAGKCMFFAGSGISFDSGLPSAETILRETANVFLRPAELEGLSVQLGVRTSNEHIRLRYEDWLDAIEERMQPELLYERLLELTEGDLRSLRLWESLFPTTWHKLGFTLRSNLAHYFIVNYSYSSRSPIITTNFDTLFEEAADELKIPYLVYTPGVKDRGLPTQDGKRLLIVKAHGTIREENGSYSLNRIMTTMTQITIIRPRLLDFIRECMASRHLVIVGYSGRDLDLFPYIENICNSRVNPKKPFWINRFPDKQRIDFRNAVRLGANIVANGYPSDVFRLLVPLDRYPDNAAKKVGSSRAHEMMNRLSRDLRREFNWDDFHKLFFMGILLGLVGRFRDSAQILNAIYRRNQEIGKLSRVEEAILLTNLWSMAHNNSRFERMGELTQEMLQTTSKAHRLFPYWITGCCYQAEFERMRVPFDTFVFGDAALDRYREQLGEALRFGTKTLGDVREAMRNNELATKRAAGRMDVKWIREAHEIVMLRIHNLSLRQRLARYDLENSARRDSPLKHRLETAWHRLQNQCERSGDALGIMACTKFRARLAAWTRDFRKARHLIYSGQNIADLMTFEANRELVIYVRLEAQVLHYKLEKSILSMAKELFEDGSHSGNNLNAIKGILALIEYNRRRGVSDFQHALKVGKRDYGIFFDELHYNLREEPLWNDYLTWLSGHYNQLYNKH